MLSDDVHEAATQARRLMHRAASPHGFLASATEEHYGLWTRDHAFTSMGANVSNDPGLVAAVRSGLLVIQPMQAATGQLPSACRPPDYWDWGESGGADPTTLYTITAAQHLAEHPDTELCAHLWPTLQRADQWLQCQNVTGFGLISSPNGNDWMESSFNRGGITLYNNVLYVRHVRAMAELAPSEEAAAPYHARHALLTRKLNDFLWPQSGFNYGDMLLGNPYPARDAPITFQHSASQHAHAAAVRADRGHYVSHYNFAQFVDECDVLGNVLAVLFDVASPDRARRIMAFLLGSDATTPYPARTYLRPIPSGDPTELYHRAQDEFQDPRWRNTPGTYHNAGVWPFIGGLYVAALHHVGMVDEAAEAMEALAAAVRLSRSGGEWGFPEWIALDGTPSEIQDQTWGAGTLLAAYQSLQGCDVRW